MKDKIKLLNAIKFNRMREVFQKMEHLNYAVVKGEVLSIEAYGQEGKRIYNDIDILVSKSDINEVKSILYKSGFVSKECTAKEKALLNFSHQIETFECVHMGIKVIVDINTSVFWGEYEGTEIGLEHFLLDCQYMTCYGVKLKSLTPIKSFIHLCLHSYKDYNSIFLLWQRKILDKQCLRDINSFLCEQKRIDIYTLKRVAEEYSVGRYVCCMLVYSYVYLKDNRLLPYIKETYEPEVVSMIRMFGLSTKERKKWDCKIEERLFSDNVRDLIRDKLTERDFLKIQINDNYF